MGQKTGIGWTDHTCNFWWGCNRVSEECRHCYIEPIMKRAGVSPFDGPIRTKNWTQPRKWNQKAKDAAERRRVFTCSMSDFFHEGADPWRDDAWQVIRECESLDWLILTKRPDRFKECLPDDWGSGYANVWLGVTCGHTRSFHRLPYLAAISARLKFVSAEPLLERLNFRPFLHFIDWIITGCEQAAKGKRRLMKLDWVRDIDLQCRESNIAHFFKQYYDLDRGVPKTDGVLDNQQRQDFPDVVTAQRIPTSFHRL